MSTLSSLLIAVVLLLLVSAITCLFVRPKSFGDRCLTVALFPGMVGFWIVETLVGLACSALFLVVAFIARALWVGRRER